MARERLGVNAVAGAAAKMGIIWRETPMVDVGIDGQLEFVDSADQATGRTVALQVKSGASYFKSGDGESWHFYPAVKHRGYWERYPLPVLLILHSIADDRSYWADARQALRSPGASAAAYIAVPKQNVLQQAKAIDLFENAGVSADPFLPDLGDVLRELVTTRSGNGSFPVSWFDLFAHGLTNLCRSLYYGTDLAMGAAEYNLEENGSQFGVGVGPSEHEFLFGFVRYLVAQHLADVDFGDCLLDWHERDMQPHFIAPLTQRDRNLVALISAEEDKRVTGKQLEAGNGLRVAQEGYFQMVERSYIRRWPRIRCFQDLLRSEYERERPQAFGRAEA